MSKRNGKVCYARIAFAQDPEFAARQNNPIQFERFGSADDTVDWNATTVRCLRGPAGLVGAGIFQTSETSSDGGAAPRCAVAEEWAIGHDLAVRIVSNELFLSVQPKRARDE